ncbi:MAG: hypothetical protein HGA19_13995 [Oscillochloris sp.]|nr:hypothetical protein [Oscillochloris sp.]
MHECPRNALFAHSRYYSWSARAYARNEQRSDSDLDLLVTFRTPGLFKYIELD